MLFLVAADAVVALHLLWIVFLVAGAAAGVRWRWVKWTHLAALAFSVMLQAFGWICPLTHLEAWLRSAGGAAPYEGTFIRHYLEQFVYTSLPPNIILFGTLLVVAVSLWVYFGPRRR
jgi:hypothetical protein